MLGSGLGDILLQGSRAREGGRVHEGINNALGPHRSAIAVAKKGEDEQSHQVAEHYVLRLSVCNNDKINYLDSRGIAARKPKATIAWLS